LLWTKAGGVEDVRQIQAVDRDLP